MHEVSCLHVHAEPFSLMVSDHTLFASIYHFPQRRCHSCWLFKCLLVLCNCEKASGKFVLQSLFLLKKIEPKICFSFKKNNFLTFSQVHVLILLVTQMKVIFKIKFFYFRSHVLNSWWEQNYQNFIHCIFGHMY